MKKLLCKLFNLIDPRGKAVFVFPRPPIMGDSLTIGDLTATFLLNNFTHLKKPMAKVTLTIELDETAVADLLPLLPVNTSDLLGLHPADCSTCNNPPTEPSVAEDPSTLGPVTPPAPPDAPSAPVDSSTATPAV